MKYLNKYDQFFEEAKPLKRTLLHTSDDYDNLVMMIRKSYRSNQIANFLNNIWDVYTQFNYIKVGTKNDEIIFTPSNRINSNERNDNLFKMSKDSIKIGRFISKLWEDNKSEPIPQGDLNQFIVAYKQYWDLLFNKKNINFKVVSGEDIRYWYLIDNYSKLALLKHGTLANSCMAPAEKQDFLNIYVENPEVCQMVIQLDSENKLLSRALLWKLTDGTYFLDRIYYTREEHSNLLKEWAKSNYNISEFYKRYEWDPISLKVQLKSWKFKHYPYIDTLDVLNYYNGTLTKDSVSKYYPELTLGTVFGGVNLQYGWIFSNKENKYIPLSHARYDKETKDYVLSMPYKLIRFLTRYKF